VLARPVDKYIRLTPDEMTNSETTKSQTNYPGNYFRTSWRVDLAALAILFVAVLIFFLPVVLGQAWIPRGGGDSVSFLYPMYRFAAQSFRSGVIPLWNPYQYAGSLFIADNQTGIFYPPNLLLFLLKPDFSYTAIQWLVIGHFLFAGISMYFCMRLLRPHKAFPPAAGLSAALAYMFGGVFIAHIGNLNLIAVAAWLPLSFLALHLALLSGNKERRVGLAILGGVFLGIGTLAGHGQMTFLLAAYLGFYALYRAISEQSFWPLMALLLLGVTAAGLAAINLIPSLEAVQYSVRAEFDSQRSAGYALPWRGLLGLFAPDFYGRGQVRFWGDWPRVEYGYVGVLTLFLAGVGLVNDRTRLTRFFAISTLLFAVLALGNNTPLYPLLVRLVPVFPFQVPARFVLLLDFSLAGLAAIGMAQLMERPRTLHPYLFGTAIAGLGILALLFWQYRISVSSITQHQEQMLLAIGVFSLFALCSWLLIWSRSQERITAKTFSRLGVLLLAVDLIALGWYVELEPNDPERAFADGSPALAFLKENAGLQRVEIATSAWQPNLPQLEGLYSIDGVYNPLELANYAVYIGSVGFRGSPMYNLLGTKYIVAGKSDPPGDTAIIVPVLDQDPDVTLYLNTLALPRAMVLHKARVVSDHDAAFTAIHDESFDPQQVVILEEGEPLEQEAGQSAITVLAYEPNYAAFEVTSDRPAYFLLSDIHHPQWQATVNDQEAPILVADYALRAVYLPAGTHTVEMRFRPPAWTWGVTFTLFTILLLLIILIWYWRTVDSLKANR
jgi:hypothetical protein